MNNRRTDMFQQVMATTQPSSQDRSSLLNQSRQEENHLKVLRLLETDPRMNQRELADALGVSLGKTNYCIKALLDKGLIKMESFRKNPNKLAYAYLLTPVGITEKGGLTACFLKRKMHEYSELHTEIQALQREIANQDNAKGTFL